MWRKLGLAIIGAMMGVLVSGVSSAQTGGGEETSEFGGLACYEVAVREAWLDSHQALLLCRGAMSVAPAECLIAARSSMTRLNEEDAIMLCRCALSTAPAECYQRAEADTFLDTWQIVQLCGPSRAYNLLPDCRQAVSPLYPLLPHL
jgi:hypothetical protein